MALRAGHAERQAGGRTGQYSGELPAVLEGTLRIGLAQK